MIKLRLTILACMATLLLLTTLAHSAEPETSTAAVTVVTLAPSNDSMDVPLVNAMINLLDSDVGYSLNQSTAIVLACNPFADQQSDTPADQPASDFSVGLIFTF